MAAEEPDTISTMTSGEPGRPSAESSAGVEADLLDSQAAGPAALRGSVLRTGSYVLGILLSLISVRVLFGHLGLEDFGRYNIVLALVTIVSGFTEGGLNSVVLREFATLPPDHRREMMRSAIGMRLVLTTVGVGFAVAFAAVAGYSGTLVLGTALAGVGLIFQLVQSTLATTLQAELRFGWASALEILRQVVTSPCSSRSRSQARACCRCWPWRFRPRSCRSSRRCPWSSEASRCGHPCMWAAGGRSCGSRCRGRPSAP